MICKSGLVAQDTVLIFLDLVISYEERLVFGGLIEVVNVWDVVILVAAVVDVRVDESRKGILRNESLLWSIDCAQYLWTVRLARFVGLLHMAPFFVLASVSLVQLFTNQFLQLAIAVLPT